MKKLLLAGAALLICGQAYAGPQTKAPTSNQLTPNQVTSNPGALLQTFTLADLQAALDDANSQNPPDTDSANCYMALIPVVQSGIGNPVPKGLGIFQLLQKGRNAKALLTNLRSPTGPLAGINRYCAPIILDAQNTLLQLGIMTGSVVANPLHLPLFP